MLQSISLLAVFFVLGSHCQTCSDQSTCSECLTVSDCAWCSTDTTAYCTTGDGASDLSGCLSVTNPGSQIEDVIAKSLGRLNQISLESIRLKLRVGEPLTFNFTVKPAENFPLDLYILMDLSNSYKDDLVQVKQLAPDLANSLNNLTNDALIGFGTFVDKVTPPYMSQKQIDLLFTDNNGNPSCRDNEQCSLPVSFEHVSTLTNSSTEFNNSLQGVIISTNADGPEGTLDGMMQATVCTDLIGWRDNSRKVLMVMTDDLIHTAGDGKIAGVVKVNDETCHTEYSEQYDKFLYTASTEYDYPSLEQLRLVLRREGIIPVFAVPMDDQPYFQVINELLNGFVAVTAGDSSNLLDVVAEAYNEVVSQVSADFDRPNFLQTQVSFACPQGNVSDEICTNIKGNAVNINMTITLTECANDVSQGNVYPLDVIIPGFDRITVYITGECSCNCDNMPVEVMNDSRCVNGDLICGRCYCNDGWKDDACNCSTNPCPVVNGQECGPRGTCDGCSSCTCDSVDSPQNGVADPRIFGGSCECSNFECETDSNGNACSGRGTCECEGGVYSCNCSISVLTGEMHDGDVCQCSSDHCVDPDNTDSGVCSGSGSCSPCEPQGTACTCNTGFIGNYCQFTLGRSSEVCGRSDEGCIECYGEAAEDNDNAESACGSNCQGYIALENSQASDYEIPGTVNGSTIECSHSTTECTYKFYVGTTLTSDLRYAVEPRSCLPLPIWAIAVIIIVGLLIIGIAIIVIIKLCVMWLDYREYKRFLYDVQNADKQLQSNPVYQDPITHVDNPVHGKAVI